MNARIRITWFERADRPDAERTIIGTYMGLTDNGSDLTHGERLHVDVGDPTGPHAMARWAIEKCDVLRDCGGCNREAVIADGDYLCEACRQ